MCRAPRSLQWRYLLLLPCARVSTGQTTITLHNSLQLDASLRGSRDRNVDATTLCDAHSLQNHRIVVATSENHLFHILSRLTQLCAQAPKRATLYHHCFETIVCAYLQTSLRAVALLALASTVLSTSGLSADALSFASGHCDKVW
jgi:hypothetical protein